MQATFILYAMFVRFARGEMFKTCKLGYDEFEVFLLVKNLWQSSFLVKRFKLTKFFKVCRVKQELICLTFIDH